LELKKKKKKKAPKPENPYKGPESLLSAGENGAKRKIRKEKPQGIRLQLSWLN